MKLLSSLLPLNETIEKRNEHLTPEEQYHRYGDIKGKACEDLLDTKEKFESFTDGILTELSSCFPEEDFLSEKNDELKDIIKGMNKSVHKEKLTSFLESLEQTQTEVFQSAEYGFDIIRKLKKKLGV